VARWAVRPGKVFTAVFDIVFWLFIATMVFRFLLAYSWGEVRFYMLVGFAMGFSVYRVIVGNRVVGGCVSTYEYMRYVRRKMFFGFREELALISIRSGQISRKNSVFAGRNPKRNEETE